MEKVLVVELLLNWRSLLVGIDYSKDEKEFYVHLPFLVFVFSSQIQNTKKVAK